MVPVLEACAYSHVKRTKLFKLIHDKKVVSTKVGRDRLVDLDSVDRYFKELIAC
jgi:excisionase family DNA binding protein